jgi:uncharacterized protein YdeI (YjbR/CyaY-like superfamily)
VLKKNPIAQKTFEALSYSKKQAIVVSIEGAKTRETRGRRIEKAVNELK